ncbi:MAG: phosphate regulon sensor histidine kinase PhoR [Gammaproteobacteria bacterium RIFCSPHIGHO2_12_FULL_35_23]|nr:MAG: phosphate regulon sensor histidine kinase PhoR [Gammaproteobacteria bacterium RIFCSPHIGHO2_12_FULL_35_23]
MNIQQLANALPDAILLLNNNGEIIWANQQAQTLLPVKKLTKAQTPAALIGKEAFAKSWSNKAEDFFEGKLSNHKYITYCLKKYEQNHYLFIIQDISRTHHLERMRQDFVANVSHELRTPLTVIRGFVEILLTKLKNKQTQEILLQIEQQSKRMQNIIEELLFLASLENIEHRETNYESIEVPHLLELIKQDAEKLSQGRHQFMLEIDTSLILLGVRNELYSLFSNLIFNAVNYTPAPGKIIIRWFLKENQAVFEIVDNGIGIEKKHIDRITERFYRVDKARSSASGGTGLGLAIVKHVLIHHQAKLVIKSKLQQGSTFTCTFPEKLIQFAKNKNHFVNN